MLVQLILHCSDYYQRSDEPWVLGMGPCKMVLVWLLQAWQQVWRCVRLAYHIAPLSAILASKLGMLVSWRL
jgi:hypothetical protein